MVNRLKGRRGSIILGSLLSASAATLAVFAPQKANAEGELLNPPETEIGLALTDLDAIQKRLVAAGELAKKTGLGPQTAAADRAYSAGVAYFAASEHLSTIREFNTYLNTSQTTEPERYLKAQYMLGRSHEASGNPTRALRAYLRYLSTFLTHKQPDFKELEDILHRILPLAAKDSAGERRELDQFLSSVMTLDLPKEVFPGLAIAAARTASGAGHYSLATSWLEKAVTGTDNPELQNRAVYMRAVIDIANRDFESAESRLTDILSTSGKQTAEIRDLARLALARIAVHRKKSDLALKYYGFIDELSPSFKDALFEVIYVHLDLGNDTEARERARFFVTRYPMEPNAFQVRVLLSYLDLRAGDLKGARDGITETSGDLESTNSWMKSQVRGKDRISQTTLNDLVSRTAGMVEIPPLVREAHIQFGKIAELKNRLAEVRGEVRNIIFTIGRANIEHLRPDWVNRTTQIADIGDDLLRVGHRLVGMERTLLADRLTPVQKKELESSEDRRTRLLTEPAKFRRAMESWKSYVAFADLTQDLFNSYSDLQKADAQIANSALHLESKKAAGVKSEDIERARIKSNRLRDKLFMALEATRTAKVLDLVNQSPHRAVKKKLTLYSMSLGEEHEVMAGVREVQRDRTEELLFADIDRAWNLWKEASRSAFEQISILEQDIENGLNEIVSALAKHEAMHLSLDDKLSELNAKLESHLGKSSGLIEDLYSNAVNSRLSRHQKWSADLDWLGYAAAEKDQKKFSQKVDLERQILKDNLTDLQQGALWSWPE